MPIIGDRHNFTGGDTLNDLNFPLIRIGHVCSAERILGNEDSLRVADEIWSQRDTVREELVSAICEAGGESPREFPGGDGHRGAERRILTFPIIVFGLEGKTFTLRPSLTVCRDDRHSKLWIGLLYFEADRRAADSLDPNEVLEFYSRARWIGDSLMHRLQLVYSRFLKDLAMIQDIQARLKFEVKGSNTSEPEFAEFLQATLRADTVSEVLGPTSNVPGKSVLAGLLAAHGERPVGAAVGGADDTSVRWRLFEEDGNLALYRMGLGDGEAGFNVFCYNPTKEPDAPSSAKTMSRGILELYASVL